jgi:hypothetical protein
MGVVIVGNTDKSKAVLITVKYILYQNKLPDMLRNAPEKEFVGA